MKKLPIIGVLFLSILLALGCREVISPDIKPAEISQTNSATPIPTQIPTLLPAKTPRATFDISQFKIQINEKVCSLKEVEFYGLYVFQADCPDEIYMAQAQTVSVTLLPPGGQIYPISPIPDQETIFGSLEPPFEYGEYIPSDQANTAVYAIPMFKYSGEPILCGFSIPLQEKDIYIVVTGLTTRAF